MYIGSENVGSLGEEMDVILATQGLLLVPPEGYGGVEEIVAVEGEDLASRGHRVTVLGPEGSRVKGATIVPISDGPIWGKPEAKDPDSLKKAVSDALDIAVEYIAANQHPRLIVHNHTEWLLLDKLQKAGLLGELAVATTVHGTLFNDKNRLEYEKHPDGALISITNKQREPYSGANWLATVYHGLRREKYPFQPTPDPEGYIAIVGRYHEDKDIPKGIEAAVRAGFHVKIAARRGYEDAAYYDEHMVPVLRWAGSWVEEVGELKRDEVAALMGGSLALMHAIKFDEPYGMVMKESQLCGAPVVALGRGSVRELINDGVTGYIVEPGPKEDEGLRDAILLAPDLDRGQVNKCALEQCAPEVMGGAYEQAFEAHIKERAA